MVSVRASRLRHTWGPSGLLGLASLKRRREPHPEQPHQAQHLNACAHVYTRTKSSCVPGWQEVPCLRGVWILKSW